MDNYSIYSQTIDLKNTNKNEEGKHLEPFMDLRNRKNSSINSTNENMEAHSSTNIESSNSKNKIVLTSELEDKLKNNIRIYDIDDKENQNYNIPFISNIYAKHHVHHTAKAHNSKDIKFTNNLNKHNSKNKKKTFTEDATLKNENFDNINKLTSINIIDEIKQNDNIENLEDISKNQEQNIIKIISPSKSNLITKFSELSIERIIENEIFPNTTKIIKKKSCCIFF